MRRRKTNARETPGLTVPAASLRNVVAAVTAPLVLPSVMVPPLESDGAGLVNCVVFAAQLLGAAAPFSLMTTLDATRSTQPAPPPPTETFEYVIVYSMSAPGTGSEAPPTPVELNTSDDFTSFRKPVYRLSRVSFDEAGVVPEVARTVVPKPPA